MNVVIKPERFTPMELSRLVADALRDGSAPNP